MQHRKIILGVISLLVAGVLLASFSLAGAQESFQLNIEKLDDAGYPKLDVYVTVTDNGLPVSGLTSSDFTMSEDEKPVTKFTVSTFSNDQQPVAFIILLDNGNTMGGNPPKPLDLAVEASKGFLNSLTAQDLVGLIAFATRDPDVLQELTADKNAVGTALERVKVNQEKWTGMYAAIVKGVELLAPRSERKAIILITDGRDDLEGATTFDDAVATAVKEGIPVYPIGIGSKIDEEELLKIAQITGGIPQIRPDNTALREAYDNILKLFREQYLLQYTSDLPADGKEHTLLVTATYTGKSAEDTQQFVAREGSVTVKLANIKDGDEIRGSYTFTPQVLAPGEVTGVVVSLDGKPLETLNSAPFEYTWDSTTVTPGEYTLAFTAKDAVGNEGETSIKVLVSEPVIVSIKSPTSGESVSGTVKIVAEVDSHADVDKVEILGDGKVIETFTDPPYETEWGLARASEGQHEITVTARDAHGHEDDAKVNIYVTARTGGGLSSYGILAIALVGGLATIGIIIPLVLRSRRQRGPKAAATVPSAPPPGPSRATPGGQPGLYEVEGLSPGQVWPLRGPEIHLGRMREENDIHLKGLTASRRHAVIRLQGGYYYVYSLNPENPVIVNNVPIRQQQVLRPGDMIRAGESLFRFEA